MSKTATLLIILLAGLACSNEESSAPPDDPVIDSVSDAETEPTTDMSDEPDEPTDTNDGTEEPGPEMTVDESPDFGPLPSPSGPTLGETLCLAAAVPGGNSENQVALREFFFARMAEIGVRYLRWSFAWHRVEPEKGTFDFSKVDEQIGWMEAHDIEPIGLLGYGNPWASEAGRENGNDPYYPPDDPEDFATYAGAMAERYQGRIRLWEIWNEQNAGYRFWKQTDDMSGDPVAYGALLAAAYREIVATDPDAVVSFGGLFYLPQFITGAEDFLTAVYDAHEDIENSFDTLSYHPYSIYPPRHPPEMAGGVGSVDIYPVDETARRMSAIIEDYEGGVAKPLWVTEIGWPTMGVEPLDQARYQVRSYLLLFSEGVEILCAYTFMDSNPSSSHLAPQEGFFGLFEWASTDDGDPVPKPIFDALRVLYETLGSLRFVANLGPREGLDVGAHLLGFAADEGDPLTRVVWSSGVENIEVSFEGEPGMQYDLIDLLGPCDAECLAVHQLDVGEDGRVTLQATPSPLYIIEVID